MAGMRNVTLRQLQIFVAAADSLSFSRASAQLHLTQPAISMQIRQLEHSAGLPLFERQSRPGGGRKYRTILNERGHE